MPSIATQIISTPVGEMILGSFEEQLCLADWRYRSRRNAVDSRIRKYSKSDYVSARSDVVDAASSQLEEYFAGQRQQFSVPLKFFGTEFQCEVWTALTQIPFGVTLSYLELATQINKPSAVRAVAAANGANALSIFVPCHRVIGANGELTGYAGGLNAKRRLLDLEGAGPHSSAQLALFE